MKETVYEHVDGDSYFCVTAAERWSVGMIRRLKDQYPEQVEITYENQDGSIVAHLPKEWMRIVPKRKSTMTEEQKKLAGDRLRAARTRLNKENLAAISEDCLKQV